MSEYGKSPSIAQGSLDDVRADNQRRLDELRGRDDGVIVVGVDLGTDGMTTECTCTKFPDGTIRVDGIHRYDPKIDIIDIPADGALKVNAVSGAE